VKRGEDASNVDAWGTLRRTHRKDSETALLEWEP